MLWMRKKQGPLVAINHKPHFMPSSLNFSDQFFREAVRQGRRMVHWEKECRPDLLMIIDWTHHLEKLEQYRAKGAKVVFRINGVDLDQTGKPITPEYRRKAWPKADAAIFQTEFCLRAWKDQMAIDKPYTLILNGADERIFSRRGASENFGFSRFMVTAAKWQPWKALDQVVDVFLKLDRNDVGLVVIGDNAEVPKHPRIKATGRLGHKDMAKVFRAAELFIYLPWQEWCPKVVSQALVAGLPVVCSYRGGTRELVQDCGVIVHGAKDNDLADFSYNPVNLDEAVAAVQNILENPRRIRERPDLFLSNMVREYFKFFEQVLGHG